jgi:hydrogenase-4 component B
VDIERLGGLSRFMPYTALSFLVGGIAISALPPFNGFTSEFVIYSGLFSAQKMPVGAQVALVGAGALLAFVGAVSALSITRAFGVVFLGSPRDASTEPAREVSRWMLLPMGLHALGVLVLGVFPALGFLMVQGPVGIALAGLPGPPAAAAEVLAQLAQTLSRVGVVAALLLALVLLLVGLRALVVRSATVARSATWGCGYGRPNTRMQYTGASFSSDFGNRFRGVMVLVHRQKAPEGYFPSDAWLITDCVDAVERRLFSVINHGDASASAMSRLLREDDPRVAFAAGLLALVVIAGLVLLAGGPLS